MSKSYNSPIFLPLSRELARYVDRKHDTYCAEFLPVLLFIYNNCFRWNGITEGYCKTTMQEITVALRFKGNTHQYDRIRIALHELQKKGYITDKSGFPYIENYGQRPRDLLTILLQQIPIHMRERFVCEAHKPAVASIV